MRVGILGGGSWGQALARLVKAAGNDPFIAYEGKRPPHVLPSSDVPPQVTEACELILVATSASEVRSAIGKAQPHPGNRIVVAGRGLEPATSEWLTDVVAASCDAVRVGALAGPAPVDEILNGGLCGGVVASEYSEVRALTTQALHSTRYRVYESDDLTGLQLTGAMVPVLAALMGLADNLRGAGVGLRAMVLTRGLAEFGRLALRMGAQEHTLYGLAGLGDLVAAQARPGSAYYDAGARLAKGERGDGPWHIAQALSRLASDPVDELPLTSALLAMHGGANPIDVVQDLMGRRAQPEHKAL